MLARLAAAAAFAAVLALPAAAADTRSPEALGIALYQEIATDLQKDEMLYIAKSPTGYFETYAVASLNDLFKAVMNGSDGDIDYALDADVLLNAQDVDVPRDIRAETLEGSDAKAKVRVHYTAFGGPQAVDLHFVQTPEGWKIDDLAPVVPDLPEVATLRQQLNDLQQRQRMSR